jgi:hypothetical protein
MLNNADFLHIKNKYPHIADKIEALWGYPEFYLMVNKLFTDTRGGTRTGFPPEDLKALGNIVSLHDFTYPHLLNATGDIWSLHHRI